MSSVDPGESTEVTLGEVSRGLSRVERQMHDGFAAIRAEIGKLAFVPAQVYAADSLAYRDRMERVEASLRQETEHRLKAEADASQRAWQSRLGIALALIGLPLSIFGAIVTALIMAHVK